MFTKSEILELNAKFPPSVKVKPMNYTQAYNEAISMGQVQAAKKFKQLMKAELAPLEEICQALVPMKSTASDYRNLDAFVNSVANDVLGSAF